MSAAVFPDRKQHRPQWMMYYVVGTTLVYLSSSSGVMTNAFVVTSKTSSFLSSSSGGVSTSSSARKLTNFPNPFADNKNKSNNEDDAGGIGNGIMSISSSSGETMDWEDVDAYVPLIRQFLATDYGVLDGSFLSDDEFVYVGPNVIVDGPLTKEEYLAAANFFNLRQSLPDLEYRPHDVRVIERGTVRFTTRTVGTFRGTPLRLRDDSDLPPNGQRMACPPESITLTFDTTTKQVLRMVAGYTMDRQVGNTMGLCGVQALATVGGKAPPAYTLVPPKTWLSQILRRPAPQLPGEPSSYLAPFPESVMLQLCKGVLNSDLGLDDMEGILSPPATFQFLTPTVGPLNLDEFINYQQEQRQLLSPIDYQYSNFRVDPYDPYRVWVDVKALSGTIVGPPEAWSFTFDDDGYCNRITTDAVMDPTVSATAGLSGTAGLLYALGQPLSPFSTRTLPQITSRIAKSITSPITKLNVDDFCTPTRITPEMASVEISPEPSITTTTAAPKPTTPPPLPTTTTTTTPKNNNKTKTPTLNILQAFQSTSDTTPPKPNTPPPPKKAPTKQKKAPTLNIMQAFSSATPPKPNTPPPPKKTPAKVAKPTTTKQKKAPTLNIMQAFSSATPPKPLPPPKTPAKATKSSPKKSPTLNLFQAFGKASPADNQKSTTVTKQKEAAAKKEAMLKAKQEKETAAKKAALAKAKKSKQEEIAAKKAAAEEAKKAKQEEAAAKKEAMIKANQEAAAAKKAAIEEAKKAKQEEAAAKKEAILKAKEETAAAKKAAIEEAKKAKQEEAAAKKEAAEEAKKSKQDEINAKKRQNKAQQLIEKQPSGTISLGKLFFANNKDDMNDKQKPATVSAPPKGMPVLSNWRKNRDGSISGKISGSKGFEEGENVTTSPIVDVKTIQRNNVVQTKSGSKYYLI